MKFYSELTKKLYDTEKELKAAEKVVADEAAKKAEAAKSKKEDALKVEEAFKARNAARHEYNNLIMTARKDYNSALVEIKKAYDKAVEEATKIKDVAEKNYDAALKEFTAKHETYHMTLKDGDNVMTISSQGEPKVDMVKEYTDLFNQLFNFWKF